MFQPELKRTDGSVDKQTGAFFSWLSTFVAKFAAPVVAEKPKGPLKRKFAKPSGFGKYSLAQVAQHSTPEDAWIVVDGQVYDVSAMKHPGGEVIFSYAGRDASDIFRVMHKNQELVRTVLKAHLIGELASSDQAALMKDFQEMTADFAKKGLMDASPVFYIRKLTELLAMVSISLYLLWNHSSSLPLMVVSCLLQACFFFQCGWTTHDFLHHQVFKKSFWNNLIGTVIIDLGMGGSAHWWKNKHNQHHATPNKMTADEKAAVDPDIDTVPLIAWNEALLKQVATSDRGIISLQHILVWPLLFIAYINWQVQGVIHLLSFPTVSTKTRRIELTAITLHHLWVGVSVFYNLGFVNGMAFWLASHFLSGFGTAFVFIQSHNGMEIYTDDKDFVSSQMVSTRNIDPGVVVDWVFGGLNYQIEHHLYPTMPRHSYSRIRARVMQLCAKHGLPYETCSTWESTKKVYAQLAKIAKLV